MTNTDDKIWGDNVFWLKQKQCWIYFIDFQDKMPSTAVKVACHTRDSSGSKSQNIYHSLKSYICFPIENKASRKEESKKNVGIRIKHFSRV